MRALTAAAVPFAKSGDGVLLDFSVPPDFLETAKKIVKDVPLDLVVLRPSLNICDTRARERTEGESSSATLIAISMRCSKARPSRRSAMTKAARLRSHSRLPRAQSGTLSDPVILIGINDGSDCRAASRRVGTHTRGHAGSNAALPMCLSDEDGVATHHDATPTRRLPNHKNPASKCSLDRGPRQTVLHRWPAAAVHSRRLRSSHLHNQPSSPTSRH